MTDPHLPDELWDSVLPVCDDRGAIIGTGVVVAPQQMLTALHVVEYEPAPRITDRLAVTAIVSLRPWQLGRARRVARRSYQRGRTLTGGNDRAVDLALLAVPALEAPPLPARHLPVRAGELVTVHGFPRGRRTASHGPITSADDADFVAHISLGPGISGAPVVDAYGRLTGLVTMDHPSAGAIAIGPVLLTAFLRHATRQLKPRDTNPRQRRRPHVWPPT